MPDLLDLRSDFPYLDATGTRPIVYLDSATTAQKPRAVIEAVAGALARPVGSPRSVHLLGERAHAEHEHARTRLQRWIGARSSSEVVLTRSATEALNLAASCLSKWLLRPGDQVVTTIFEHHSNFLPWQAACEERGASLLVAPATPDLELDLEALERLVGPRTRIISVAQVASATGTLLPVAEVIRMGRRHGALVVVDGALALPHLPVDVAALDCDLYVGSGHKLYGPSGTGFLHGKLEILERLPPYQVGGEMVLASPSGPLTPAGPPRRFEAGTPNVEGVVGLGAAITYLERVPRNDLEGHQAVLLARAAAGLSEIPGVHILGGKARRVGALAFSVEDLHAHDLSTLLDQEGIVVRVGSLCAQPLLHSLGLDAAVRLSTGIYTSPEEIEALVAAVSRAVRIFRGQR